MEVAALKKSVDEDGEKLLFRMFYLKDDEDQSVEVKESAEINSSEIKKRLEEGESVFITSKRKLNSNLFANREAANHGFSLVSEDAYWNMSLFCAQRYQTSSRRELCYAEIQAFVHAIFERSRKRAHLDYWISFGSDTEGYF